MQQTLFRCAAKTFRRANDFVRETQPRRKMDVLDQSTRRSIKALDKAVCDASKLQHAPTRLRQSLQRGNRWNGAPRNSSCAEFCANGDASLSGVVSACEVYCSGLARRTTWRLRIAILWSVALAKFFAPTRLVILRRFRPRILRFQSHARQVKEERKAPHERFRKAPIIEPHQLRLSAKSVESGRRSFAVVLADGRRAYISAREVKASFFSFNSVTKLSVRDDARKHRWRERPLLGFDVFRF